MYVDAAFSEISSYDEIIFNLNYIKRKLKPEERQKWPMDKLPGIQYALHTSYAGAWKQLLTFVKLII